MRAAGHHEVRRSCRPHCGRRSGSAAAPGLLACYPPDPVHIVGGCSLARTRNAPLPRVSNTLLALAPLGSQPLRAPTRDSGEPEMYRLLTDPDLRKRLVERGKE